MKGILIDDKTWNGTVPNFNFRLFHQMTEAKEVRKELTPLQLEAKKSWDRIRSRRYG